MSKRLISIAFPSYSNFIISVHLQETKVYIEITKLPNLFLIRYMGFGAYIYAWNINGGGTKTKSLWFEILMLFSLHRNH